MATEKGVPSNSRVLMLLGQLERMNLEVMQRDVEMARQLTTKILHLIQTQADLKFPDYIGRQPGIVKNRKPSHSKHQGTVRRLF